MVRDVVSLGFVRNPLPDARLPRWRGEIKNLTNKINYLEEKLK